MAQPLNTLTQLRCCLDKLTARVAELEGASSAPATVTLVAGTASVADTAVTASSTVQYSRTTLGGTPGNLSAIITPGVGVTFNSSSGTETSTLTYSITY